MSEFKVGSVMRKDVLILTPDTPIRRAVARLVEAQTPAAAVIGDDGQLSGILTQKDCFRPALHASYYQEWKGSVVDHMTREPVSVDFNDDVIHVAEMFLTYPHRAFPVLERNTIAGMVHRSDVLALISRIG